MKRNQPLDKLGVSQLHKYKKIFFVGIGGIGVSALAKLFKNQGKKVIGSDKYSSEITDDLKKQGIKIYIGHNKKNLDSDTDLVIYSAAVKPEVFERKKAIKLGIKQLSYPEALGLISKDKYTIAISGTHGKSTTTAMLGLILTEAGFDPTVIVGSKLRHPSFSACSRSAVDWNENIRVGQSKYFVVEACEWRAHMLELSPKIIILTNIEKDHLDYYKSFKNLKQAFKKYVSKLPKNGLLVVNADDKVCLEVAKSAKCRVVTYGIKNKPIPQFTLQIPGRFNVYNALAASTCALELEVKPEIIKKVLTDFKGIWRRFELIEADKRGYMPKITLISDYAHHPTAVRETLKAAKELYPNRRLIAVYQPHHFDRTKRLFKEFVRAFDLADFIVLNEIYDVPGREVIKKISSNDLVRELKKRGLKAIFARNLKETKKLLLENIKGEDVILIMGAGDIYQLSTSLFVNR